MNFLSLVKQDIYWTINNIIKYFEKNGVEEIELKEIKKDQCINLYEDPPVDLPEELIYTIFKYCKSEYIPSKLMVDEVFLSLWKNHNKKIYNNLDNLKKYGNYWVKFRLPNVSKNTNFELIMIEDSVSEIIAYKNGLKLFHYHYEDNNLEGLCINYWTLDFEENSNIKSEENYFQGLLEGTSKYYFENGQIKFERNYQNDELHDTEIGYYENGNIKYKKEYSYGKLNGTYIKFFLSGKLKSRGDFIFGKLNGLLEVWYTDESSDIPTINSFKIKKIKSIYVSNKLHGIQEGWYEYTPKEKLAIQRNFQNGELSGEVKIWSYDGVLISKQNYQKNLLHSINIEYYPNGKIKYKFLYNVGELVKILEQFDCDGNPIKITKDDKSGWIYLENLNSFNQIFV